MRISQIKRKIENGFKANYSKEIFTVSKVIPRNPPVYKEYDDEELKGT